VVGDGRDHPLHLILPDVSVPFPNLCTFVRVQLANI
jgi:hypothetical protein